MRELIISQHSGTVIGIYSPVLGKGMFLTGVEGIEYQGKDEVVVFDQYDASGHLLSKTKVPIHEIKMVCPFNKTLKSKPARVSNSISFSL